MCSARVGIFLYLKNDFFFIGIASSKIYQIPPKVFQKSFLQNKDGKIFEGRRIG